MKVLRLIIMAFISVALVFSCNSKPKKMTLQNFSKMETEISLPDPGLNPELVKKVAEKYGYTYEQYKNFADEVAKDPALREKLGELRLNKAKGDSEN